MSFHVLPLVNPYIIYVRSDCCRNSMSLAEHEDDRECVYDMSMFTGVAIKVVRSTKLSTPGLWVPYKYQKSGSALRKFVKSYNRTSLWDQQILFHHFNHSHLGGMLLAFKLFGAMKLQLWAQRRQYVKLHALQSMPASIARTGRETYISLKMYRSTCSAIASYIASHLVCKEREWIAFPSSAILEKTWGVSSTWKM